MISDVAPRARAIAAAYSKRARPRATAQHIGLDEQFFEMSVGAVTLGDLKLSLAQVGERQREFGAARVHKHLIVTPHRFRAQAR